MGPLHCVHLPKMTNRFLQTPVYSVQMVTLDHMTVVSYTDFKTRGLVSIAYCNETRNRFTAFPDKVISDDNDGS